MNDHHTSDRVGENVSNCEEIDSEDRRSGELQQSDMAVVAVAGQEEGDDRSSDTCSNNTMSHVPQELALGIGTDAGGDVGEKSKSLHGGDLLGHEALDPNEWDRGDQNRDLIIWSPDQRGRISHAPRDIGQRSVGFVDPDRSNFCDPVSMSCGPAHNANSIHLEVVLDMDKGHSCTQREEGYGVNYTNLVDVSRSGSDKDNNSPQGQVVGQPSSKRGFMASPMGVFGSQARRSSEDVAQEFVRFSGSMEHRGMATEPGADGSVQTISATLQRQDGLLDGNIPKKRGRGRPPKKKIVVPVGSGEVLGNKCGWPHYPFALIPIGLAEIWFWGLGGVGFPGLVAILDCEGAIGDVSVARDPLKDVHGEIRCVHGDAGGLLYFLWTRLSVETAEGSTLSTATGIVAGLNLGEIFTGFVWGILVINLNNVSTGLDFLFLLMMQSRGCGSWWVGMILCDHGVGLRVYGVDDQGAFLQVCRLVYRWFCLLSDVLVSAIGFAYPSAVERYDRSLGGDHGGVHATLWIMVFLLSCSAG
ncbi:hypothetical protein Dimus_016729 [Dionaea muscipula]